MSQTKKFSDLNNFELFWFYEEKRSLPYMKVPEEAFDFEEQEYINTTHLGCTIFFRTDPNREVIPELGKKWSTLDIERAKESFYKEVSKTKEEQSLYNKLRESYQEKKFVDIKEFEKFIAYGGNTYVKIPKGVLENIYGNSNSVNLNSDSYTWFKDNTIVFSVPEDSDQRVKKLRERYDVIMSSRENNRRLLIISPDDDKIYYTYCSTEQADFLMRLSDASIIPEWIDIQVKKEEDFKNVNMTDSVKSTKSGSMVLEKAVCIDGNMEKDSAVRCFKFTHDQMNFLTTLINCGVFGDDIRWFFPKDDGSIKCIDLTDFNKDV